MFAAVMRSIIHFTMVNVFSLTEVLGLPPGKTTAREQ